MNPYAVLDTPASRSTPSWLVDRLQFELGRWVDERSLAYEAWRIGRTSRQRIRERAARYREAVAFLASEGLAEHPAKLFDREPVVPAVERRARRFLGLPPCQSIRWTSRPRPVFPESFGAAARDERGRNRFARAHLWTHGERGRTAVICVHGYRGGFPAIDGRAFGVPRLFGTLGFDVALAILPYHAGRAPHGTTSGALFLNDPLRTLEAMAQTIDDLRALAAWLRSEGAASVGAIGMSLGGYVTALLAAVEPALDFSVPIIPVASFADILWHRAGLRGEHADRIEAGMDLALMRRLFAPHCPLTHAPRVAPERRLVIGGAADRIVPPEHPAALAAHWGSSVEWFPGGHLAQLGRGRALARIAEVAGCQR